jgi:membrane protein implicated in regulation of membrane protease activity
MPEKRFFFRLAGAFLLGIVAFIFASFVFFLVLPVFIPLAFGALVLALIFVFIWSVVYVAMVVGVAIYYFFKPMTFEEKDKDYTIAKAEEAGRREKGESKG